MSYRSDEDAALARIDALEGNLDEAQAQLEILTLKLAVTEQSRAELAARVLSQPALEPAQIDEPARPIRYPERDPRSQLQLFAAAAGYLAIAVWILFATWLVCS